VAAGAPGVTDRDAGVVFATSYLKGWKNVPLGRLLESALHVPAVVENDVKLAAIAENWIGVARGIPDFVFLAIGTGIAAGIFVNGQLVHGADWVAGEVGYLIVPGTPHMPARQGSPGSLESMIGGEGIRQYWLRSNGEQATNRTGDLSATGIFYHALAGNRRAKAVLEQSARILAFAVYNISTVLNSSLFVLGGGVGTSGPLLAATRRILEPYTQPSRPKLITSALGAEAQLIGAIRLALDRAESLIDSQLQ
jgi:glucokinase